LIQNIAHGQIIPLYFTLVVTNLPVIQLIQVIFVIMTYRHLKICTPSLTLISIDCIDEIQVDVAECQMWPCVRALNLLQFSLRRWIRHRTWTLVI